DNYIVAHIIVELDGENGVRLGRITSTKQPGGFDLSADGTVTVTHGAVESLIVKRKGQIFICAFIIDLSAESSGWILGVQLLDDSDEVSFAGAGESCVVHHIGRLETAETLENAIALQGI